MEAAAFAKENGCDFIVALGGGAVLDSSVAVAAMATNPGDLWDYVNGGTGKGQPLVNKPLPQVTVTLTAGTGSEINNWGVISRNDTHEKIGFGGAPELVPVLAVVDPELMKTVPSKYTAYQGFDALFHNTEVMMSNGVKRWLSLRSKISRSTCPARLPMGMTSRRESAWHTGAPLPGSPCS